MGKRIGLKLIALAIIAIFLMILPTGSVWAAKPIEMVLATATTGGTYYPVGVALSTLWSLKFRNEKPAAIKAIQSHQQDPEKISICSKEKRWRWPFSRGCLERWPGTGLIYKRANP